MATVKRVARSLTPPFLWAAAGAAKRKIASDALPAPKEQTWEYGAEQPAEFYDERYHALEDLRRHYSESRYYPVWSLLADRIRRSGVSSILDVGCGSGQLASLLRDNGVRDYVGVDFSEARISQARAVCREFRFVQQDVFETDLFKSHPYDCVVSTEFLEHVERDLDVLTRIRQKTLVLATVPNYPAMGHVRYFGSAEEVHDRYAPVLQSLRVDEHLADPRGRTLYILEGRA